MIKSITFNGKAGYITEKYPEPICNVRGYDKTSDTLGVPQHWITDKDKRKIKEYKKKYKEWSEKYKDKYAHPQLINNLLNNKFEFRQDKINLIFGPNSSGKTTILKALAGNAGTKDGFTKLSEPLELHGIGSDKITDEDFRSYLNKLMGNTAHIEWDGVPIYYDNFINRETYGYIGDLCGSVLGNNICDEIVYNMNKKRISMGQHSMFLFNKLRKIAAYKYCYADIFSTYVNKDGSFKRWRVNDIWEKAYKIQLNYYLGFEKSLIQSPATFLFDEIDRSLDIINIFDLYTNVFPAFIKETGVQVIAISHSPLILSDKIRKSEDYNIISLNNEYTANCLECMDDLFKISEIK